jgi:hypothetical protein
MSFEWAKASKGIRTGPERFTCVKALGSGVAEDFQRLSCVDKVEGGVKPAQKEMVTLAKPISLSASDPCVDTKRVKPVRFFSYADACSESRERDALKSEVTSVSPRKFWSCYKHMDFPVFASLRGDDLVIYLPSNIDYYELHGGHREMFRLHEVQAIGAALYEAHTLGVEDPKVTHEYLHELIVGGEYLTPPSDPMPGSLPEVTFPAITEVADAVDPDYVIHSSLYRLSFQPRKEQGDPSVFAITEDMKQLRLLPDNPACCYLGSSTVRPCLCLTCATAIDPLYSHGCSCSSCISHQSRLIDVKSYIPVLSDTSTFTSGDVVFGEVMRTGQAIRSMNNLFPLLGTGFSRYSLFVKNELPIKFQGDKGYKLSPLYFAKCSDDFCKIIEYFSFEYLYPPILFFACGEMREYHKWWSQMAVRFPRFRMPNPGGKFLSSLRAMWATDRLLYVSMLRPDGLIPGFDEHLRRAILLVSRPVLKVKEAQGNYSLIRDLFTPEWLRRRKMRREANWYSSSSPTYSDFVKESVIFRDKRNYWMKVGAAMLIQIENIAFLVMEDRYARAGAMLASLATLTHAPHLVVKQIIGSWREMNKAIKYEEGSELEEEEEEEEKSDEGFNPLAEHRVRRPEAFSLEKLLKSALFVKLSALMTALAVPEFMLGKPGFLKAIVKILNSVWTSFTLDLGFAAALKGFVYTLYTKISQFCETWDFSVFLEETSFDTWFIRVSDMLSDSPTNVAARHASFASRVIELKNLIDEADGYRLKDSNKRLKKFDVTHEVLYRKLFDAYTEYKLALESSMLRAKEPFSFVEIGPPGTGKTTNNTEFCEFAVMTDPNRGVCSGNDLYSVPIHDKHFNNCHAPYMLQFNDLPGDGYNKDGLNVPDYMRLAVDREPMYTPQADIRNKVFNVIDPQVIAATTNAQVWHFSVFGTDWSKLLRRYGKDCYLVAYPKEYYVQGCDVDGANWGTLKDDQLSYDPSMAPNMRYYRATMYHTAGDITFGNYRFLCAGRENFMLHLKKRLMEYRKLPSYDPTGVERCSMRTPIPHHVSLGGRCMDGCDFVDPPKPGFTVDGAPLVDVAQGNPLSVFTGCTDRCTLYMAESGTSLMLKKRYDSIKRALYLRAQKLKVLMVDHAHWIAGGALLFAAVGAVYYARRVKPQPALLETHEEEKSPAIHTSEGVLNPMSYSDDPSFINHYGVAPAVPVQTPNPPKFPETTFTVAFLSSVSQTTSFKNLKSLVDGQNVWLLGRSGSIARCLFVDSNTFLMNRHVYLNLGPTFDIKESSNVSLRGRIICKSVAENPAKDLVLVATQTFPFADIRKHFVKQVGSQCDVVFKDEPITAAKRHLVDPAGKLGDGTLMDCITYPASSVKGDCSSVVVGTADSKTGFIIGIHAAGLKAEYNDGRKLGAAIIVYQSDLELLEAQLQRSVPAASVAAVQIVDTVQGLYPKSKFRAALDLNAEVFGTFEKCNKQAPSRIIKTDLYDYAYPKMTEKRVIPSLSSDGRLVDGKWMAPYVHKFKGMSYRPQDPQVNLLRRALADYIGVGNVPTACPLPLRQAILGVEGDPLLKKINFNTSPGVHGRFYGSRHDLFSLDSVNSDFVRGYMRYINSVESHIMFEHQKWARKDETVTLAKEEVLKYRYFMVSDLYNLIAMRQFISPLVAIMYRDKKYYEAYGAYNPVSLDFDTLCKELKRWRYILMADIKHMDSSHRSLLVDYVAEFFVDLARKAGYNDNALKIVDHLIRGIVYSIVELDGDLLFMFEGMGSGVYVTFIVNCIIISLLYRAAWFRISDAPFRENVQLAAGGDDSVGGCDDVKYTMHLIEETFQMFGYEMSPAVNKAGSLKPHYEFNEIVFLKRSPREVLFEGKKYWVGALDKDSIWKSLAFYLPMTGLSMKDRMAQVVDCASREMVLWGEPDFLAFNKDVKGFGYSLRHSSWDTLFKKYVVGDLYEGATDRFVFDTLLLDEAHCFSAVAAPSAHVFGSVGSTFATSRIQDEFGEYYEVQDWNTLVLQVGYGVHFCCSCHRHAYGYARQLAAFRKRSLPVFTSIPYEKLFEKTMPNYLYLQLSALLGPEILSLGIALNLFEICPSAQKQFIGSDTNQKSLTDSITTFNLDSELLTSEAPTHYMPLYASPTEILSIQEFFKRPQFIATIAWTTASTSSAIGDAYALWLADHCVSSKMHNYRMFRGRPKLTVLVNGNPFNFGKLMITADMNPGDDGYAGTTTANVNTLTVKHIAQAVQVPHIEIDPSASNTYELRLPFYSTNGWYDRKAANKQPTMLLASWVFNALATSTAVAASTVTVDIYFSLDDIELSVPAVWDPEGWEFESSNPEEKQSGPISTALTAGGNLAGTLTAFPAVAPFATVAEVVLNAGSWIAGLFGLAKPVVLDLGVNQFAAADRLALYNGRSNSSKLAFDGKQGVAVTADAPGVGDNGDTQIANIIQRRGLVAQYSWTDATLKQSLEVRPTLTMSDGTYTYPTPLSFVTVAFTYWTGSLVFEIEVVATAFHRGRLGVSWIPYDGLPADAVVEWSNRFMTKIMDLTKTKKITFEVPYGAIRPFLDVVHPDNTEIERSNGRLYVYALTAPLSQSGAALPVNVYLHAGKDFSLQVPTTENFAQLKFFPVDAAESSIDLPASIEEERNKMIDVRGRVHESSGDLIVSASDGILLEVGEKYVRVIVPRHLVHLQYSLGRKEQQRFDLPPYNRDQIFYHKIDEIQSSLDVVGDTEPQVEQPKIINPERPMITKVFFGESCTDLIQLCKRFAVCAVVYDTITTDVVRRNFAARFAPVWDGTVIATPYTNVQQFNSFPAYFSLAFLAERGGVRKKVFYTMGVSGVNTDPAHQNKWMYLARSGTEENYSKTTFSIATWKANATCGLYGGAGSDYTKDSMNAGQEVEVPFLSRYRFKNPRKVVPMYLPDKERHALYQTFNNCFGATNNAYCAQVWDAAADDFSLHYFYCAPRYR